MASDSPRRKAAEEIADAIISGEITYSELQDKKTEAITKLGSNTPSNKEIFGIVEDADPNILKTFLEGKKEKKPSRKPSRDEKNELFKHIALIALVSVIVYANTFGNEFVWDDKNQIAESVGLKNLENIPSAFTMGVWKFSKGVGLDVDYYRPIFLLSLMSDYQIWGLNPFGYHLMNLLFHILSTILLYLIVHQILGKREISLIAALLFAVHPIHTESVTFISGRADVLFLFFFLLSFYLYIKNRTRFGWGYAASVVSFFIAVLSKEMAITLPATIILYDICFTVGKIDRNIVRRLKYYLPFFAVALLYLFVRFFIAEVGTGATEYVGGSIGAAILTMSKGFVRYIQLLFVPVNLTIMHDIPIATSILEPMVLISIALLLALLAFTLKMYKKSKVAFFSIVWFFITLFPVSQIVPVATFTLIAERYLYLPSIGFCILAAVIIQKILDRFPQKRIKIAVILCLILILAFYSVRTVARNADWKDELTLWSETVKGSPYNDGAHNNLGNAYANKGMYDEAIAEYKETLGINPNHPKAHYNLGKTYHMKGLYDEAIAEFKEALRINPDNVDAHNNLGRVYFDTGLYDEAIAEYKEALRINPNYANAHYNLGNDYFNKSMYDEAIAEFKEALRINPYDADVHYNLGKTYHTKGLYDEAIAEFKEALRINPNDADTYYNLGITYGKKGMYDEAIAEFKEALRINPNHADAHSNLGNAYSGRGMYDEAIAEYKEALRIDPNHTDAHYNLGIAYYGKGLYDEAITEFKEVLRIDPNDEDTYYNLGAVYFQIGQYNLAKQEWEKTLEIDPNFEPAKERLRELEEMGY